MKGLSQPRSGLGTTRLTSRCTKSPSWRATSGIRAKVRIMAGLAPPIGRLSQLDGERRVQGAGSGGLTSPFPGAEACITDTSAGPRDPHDRPFGSAAALLGTQSILTEHRPGYYLARPSLCCRWVRASTSTPRRRTYPPRLRRRSPRPPTGFPGWTPGRPRRRAPASRRGLYRSTSGGLARGCVLSSSSSTFTAASICGSLPSRHAS